MNTPFQRNSTTFWDKKSTDRDQRDKCQLIQSKEKNSTSFFFQTWRSHFFSDVYWQKQISFICDLMVLGGCIPLFYGLTTVSRTKNECNDIHKKLKLSERISFVGLEQFFSNYKVHTWCVNVKVLVLKETEI